MLHKMLRQEQEEEEAAAVLLHRVGRWVQAAVSQWTWTWELQMEAIRVFRVLQTMRQQETLKW
jgi:hypothetical protein